MFYKSLKSQASSPKSQRGRPKYQASSHKPQKFFLSLEFVALNLGLKKYIVLYGLICNINNSCYVETHFNF